MAKKLNLLVTGLSGVVGQALKPAENSIVTRPGRYYNMRTNYAIVGKVFTKTTYKLEEQWEGTNQVFRAVVEDYQVLAEE